ncbi:uncharacterized membrane protein YjjB (DUF3815 family) [Ereboglobus sp. PH5-10]|uniref:threonine/serine exporter family protein n=1 Tax=Ereboglobus sp. PH5-10 TaxID=2940629 RepID=UPI0024068F60|nr:threonine/serine exporter family protein [Ereboglobus sp. PH5-10]MDF9826280.1 uncharacterized membrane protein YjjB (DUF3815 family) [Ereboglobus sp. PH5-10]
MSNVEILPLLLDLLQDMALAAVPAAGFAMVFNVPVRVLKYCALFGALAHGMRFLMMRAGMPIEWGTLIAATAVSFAGVWLARRLRAHPKAFTVAAMIPMIPGVSFFTTIIALHQLGTRGFDAELFSVALTNGLRTFFIIGAIAIGLAMPGLLLYRRRPVV